jgi:hypothetical protein
VGHCGGRKRKGRTESRIPACELLEPRNRKHQILHRVHREVLRRYSIKLSTDRSERGALGGGHELAVEVAGGGEAGVGEGFGEGGGGAGLTAV